MEEATFLTKYGSKVYIIHRSVVQLYCLTGGSQLGLFYPSRLCELQPAPCPLPRDTGQDPAPSPTLSTAKQISG